jgi:hypothetical protein
MLIDCLQCAHAIKVSTQPRVALISPDMPDHVCTALPPTASVIATETGPMTVTLFPMVGRASLRCSLFREKESENAATQKN